MVIDIIMIKKVKNDSSPGKQEIPSSGGRDARVLHLPVLLVYLLPRPLG